MADQPQGTPAPQAGTGEPPQALTAEEVNKAITARFSSFEKKIGSLIGDAFAQRDAAKAAEREKREAEKAAKEAEASPQRPADPAVTGGSAKAGEADPLADHPLLKSLQKQLSEQKNKTAALERENAEAKAKAERLEAESRDKALRSKLGEQLAQFGIDGARAKHAVGFLVDAEKRVRYADDGSLAFLNGEETTDLASGLKAWAATEDAKLYLPPRGASGSGERPLTGAGGNRGGAPSDPESQLKAIIANSLGFGG